MNDYRILTHEQLIAHLQAGDPNATGIARGYVRGDLPTDREGLLAAVHAQCLKTDEQVVAFNLLAEQLAKQTNQRVYHVATTTKWNLLLFALDDGEYDQIAGGRYADDQYISYYDPDGTFKFVGCS